MNYVDLFVTGVGMLMSYAYYPQAWRIYRLKSAQSVSTGTYVILAIGTTTWTLYGFYLNNPIIILSFIFGMFGSILVLALKQIYRD